MSNLKKKLNAIIGDLDKNIKNKEDLDYIKSQIYNISLLFLDEMDKLAEMNLNRINVMAEREKELGHKLSKLERMINNIEKEVFVSPECDFEIICPYCNNKNNPKREYCYMCGKKICKEKDIPSHVEYQQFLKDNFSNDDTKTYINNLRMSPIETENDLNTLEKETNINNEENENNCTFRFVYCGKCGSKNIIEDNYCTKCGYKLRK